MSVEGLPSRSAALRDKQRVILLCAPVTLLFAIADSVALQRFSPLAFGVRLAWVAVIVGTALLLPRVSAAVERRLMMALAVSSCLFFALLAQLTGGFTSPLFHWILAMPLVIAVVLQEHPRATLGAGLTTLCTGITILRLGGQSAALAIEWAVQAAGMSALAVYASVTYRRLRAREQALREAGLLADERARASEEEVKARDEFLSIAAHELRTPLTALRLQADRLARQRGPVVPPPEAQGKRDPVTAIRAQVDRLAELVEKLLDITRLEAGRLVLEPALCDLCAVVSQAIQRFAPPPGEPALIEFHPPGPVTAVVDAGRLEQVLSNLLANATKYGEGKPVEVALTSDGARARITVQDRGIGIAPEDQERIFRRFERAVPTRHFAGFGLGLWISRRTLQEMGGRIDVRSEPGKGSTFTVEVPLATHAAARSAER
jgi:signal transduction histidine kinase